jgi:hypothetical protein
VNVQVMFLQALLQESVRRDILKLLQGIDLQGDKLNVTKSETRKIGMADTRQTLYTVSCIPTCDNLSSTASLFSGSM